MGRTLRMDLQSCKLSLCGRHLPFGRFRHAKGEADQGYERGASGSKKSGAVSEVIDHHAGSQAAQRGANALDRGDGALGQVVAPRCRA